MTVTHMNVCDKRLHVGYFIPVLNCLQQIRRSHSLPARANIGTASSTCSTASPLQAGGQISRLTQMSRSFSPQDRSRIIIVINDDGSSAVVMRYACVRSYNAGVKKTASDYPLPFMLPRVMRWSPRSDEAQKEFLRRTAVRIVSSTNSAQLEMLA